MTEDETRQIVQDHLESLMRQMGLTHWSINVQFDLRDEDAETESFVNFAKVFFVNEYDTAVIKLRPECFDDRESLLQSLRHELYHVVLARMELARSIAHSGSDGSAFSPAAFELAWRFGVEQTVIQLGRMFHGLTVVEPKPSPKPIIEGDPPCAPCSCLPPCFNAPGESVSCPPREPSSLRPQSRRPRRNSGP